MRESDIQKSIIDYLHVYGCYAQKVQSGAVLNAYTGSFVKMADAGHPDLVVSRRALVIDGIKVFPLGFIEVKTPKGELSDVQIERLRELHRKGHAWLIAAELDDVRHWLDDAAYHGKEKFVRYIIDEGTRFVPAGLKNPKAKLTASQLLQFNTWADKKEISTSSDIPF